MFKMRPTEHCNWLKKMWKYYNPKEFCDKCLTLMIRLWFETLLKGYFLFLMIFEELGNKISASFIKKRKCGGYYLNLNFRFSRTMLWFTWPLDCPGHPDGLVSSLQNPDLMSQSCVESVVLALETWAPGEGGRRQRQLTGS